MKYLIIFSFVGFIFTGLSAQPAEQTLNLGDKQIFVSKEITVPANEEIVVYTLNALANDKIYKLEVEQRTIRNEPLPSGNLPSSFNSDSEEICVTPIKDFTKAYKSISTERALDSLRNHYLNDLKSSECDAAYIERLRELGKNELVRFTLKEGQEYQVRLSRQGKEWNYVFKTKPKGKWDVHYGFNFGFNWLSPKQRYFAKENQNGQYVITAENEQAKVDFHPSLLFQWFANTDQAIHFSPQMGVGFDLKSPSVFLGVTAIYRYNISLSGGLMMSEKSFLKGRYAPTDVIDEQLDFDQLHSQAYRPSIYVSFGFRFSENPFKN